MQDTPLILLAEDDENDEELFRRVFRRVNTNAVLSVLRCGRSVLDYLSGSGEYADRSLFPFPGLLVIDMRLPRVDGNEILSWIRGHTGLPPLFVVMLSGMFPDPRIHQTLEHAGNSTICHPPFAKPPTQETLISVMAVYENWLANNAHPAHAV